MKLAIVIPARYGSSRMPGKPLALIAGKPMLQWVVEQSQAAAKQFDDCSVIVTSEDDRILDLAKTLNVATIKTSDTCRNGTERAWEAVQQLDEMPDVVVNMQGDAPLTPAEFLVQLIECFNDKSVQVSTVAEQLTWEKLDELREHKKTTPFSGTTAILGQSGDAAWFSKNIIPAIRKEDRSQPLSPVYRHIGLYAYTPAALQKFLSWPEGHYEGLEQLEQLRFLENGISIRTAVVDYKGRPSLSGVDSPEDRDRAEALLLAQQKAA